MQTDFLDLNDTYGCNLSLNTVPLPSIIWISSLVPKLMDMKIRQVFFELFSHLIKPNKTVIAVLVFMPSWASTVTAGFSICVVCRFWLRSMETWAMAASLTHTTRSLSSLTTWGRSLATPSPTRARRRSDHGETPVILLWGPTSRSTTPVESAPWAHSTSLHCSCHVQHCT